MSGVSNPAPQVGWKNIEKHVVFVVKWNITLNIFVGEKKMSQKNKTKQQHLQKQHLAICNVL